jgi:hypothetical protein
MPYSVEPSDSERQGAVVVVPETADAALLKQPLRCVADVEAIERIPLDSRLGVVDISQRIALGLAAHDPSDTAIFYVSDGDVDRRPLQIPFSELRGNIDKTGARSGSAELGAAMSSQFCFRPFRRSIGRSSVR